MMRTTAKRIGRGCLIPGLALAALTWSGGAPVRAQDDYAMLSSDVREQQTVAVLVTGWHSVTGDEPGIGAPGAGNEMVAITGDDFVKSTEDNGRVLDVRRFENLPVVAMKVDATALAAAKSYDSGVRIYKDLPVKPLLADSGPMVGAVEAHRSGYTGKGTFVAVVDTGTDVAHPFIAGRQIIEACFADRCPNGHNRMVGAGAARPVHSHGTHVAGIALGRGKEIAGVAPEAGLIAINVFNREGGARNSNILGALDWLIGLAWTRRINIASVNMSLGGLPHRATPCRDLFFDMATRWLAWQNVAVVAAAGNESNKRGISHPACVTGVISVGAIDKGARVAKFSNSAPILDVLAPGVAIRSAVPRSESKRAPFKEDGGTSMAAPHVAGAYAVLRQAAPHRSLQDIHHALVRSRRKIRDRRNGITKPALDVAGALAALGVPVGERTGENLSPSVVEDQRGGWRPVGE